MEEQETIDGFDIPTRELTAEEASRDLTPDRIRDFEIDAGEAFLDQFDHLLNTQAIMGFLMARHPDKASQLLAMGNQKYATLNDLNEIFVPEWSEENHCKMLQDICDFINLTVNTKKRMNTNLIVHYEHYNS
jgi:hypothetical protein